MWGMGWIFVRSRTNKKCPPISVLHMVVQAHWWVKQRSEDDILTMLLCYTNKTALVSMILRDFVKMSRLFGGFIEIAYLFCKVKQLWRQVTNIIYPSQPPMVHSKKGLFVVPAPKRLYGRQNPANSGIPQNPGTIGRLLRLRRFG
jgi:hypothetical protein